MLFHKMDSFILHVTCEQLINESIVMASFYAF